ncbi:MAG: hypothetical protein HUJ73_01815 [Eubacterium sp.]|nr:hypothetical protein [Eubacterium sp.]
MRELDVTACKDLVSLWCGENKIENLDVSKCTRLSTLDAQFNSFTTLDISCCPNLINLRENGVQYGPSEFMDNYMFSDGQNDLVYDRSVNLITGKLTDLSLSESSFTYTGSAIKPAVVVKSFEKILNPATDYTVSYSNNINAGTASVTVTGKGIYKGTLKKNFTITKAKPVLAFSDSKVSKTYGNAPFTFALKTKKTDGVISWSSSNTAVAVVDNYGKVTIRGAGTAKITAKAAAGKNYEAGSAYYTLSVAKAANVITAKDITGTTASTAQKVSIGATAKGAAALSYKSGSSLVKVSSKGVVTIPKNFVGSAVITITAKATANYKAATKTITVTVNPKATSLTKVTNPAKKTLTAQWNRISNAGGYQIQYAANSSFTSAKAVTAKGGTTVKKSFTGSFVKGKTYYVRIRTYKTVGGKNYYSAWSKALKIRITK